MVQTSRAFSAGMMAGRGPYDEYKYSHTKARRTHTRITELSASAECQAIDSVRSCGAFFLQLDHIGYRRLNDHAHGRTFKGVALWGRLRKRGISQLVVMFTAATVRIRVMYPA